MNEDKTIPFRQRVQNFWQWFTENEAELSQMVERRDDYESDRMVEFVSRGTALLSDRVQFNLGGDYEFTFSVEGNTELFYLYPYVVSCLPPQFAGKWHFFPFNPGTDGSFSFGIYGVMVDMEKVRVGLDYREEEDVFTISFYEKQLCSLPEAECYNAFFIMMEIMLGEGLSYQYIGDAKRADAPAGDMISLSELRSCIVDTLTKHDKKVCDNPRDVYTGYRLQPQDNEELRYDVVAGSTCFEPLITEYYQESTELFDRLNEFGVKAAFLAFSYDIEEGGNEKDVLNFRFDLEDRIEAELLAPEGLGFLLGGAIGESTCYIDLLLYDEATFVEKIIPFLKDYPQYRFYLSDFRQHCELTELFCREDEA